MTKKRIEISLSPELPNSTSKSVKGTLFVVEIAAAQFVLRNMLGCFLIKGGRERRRKCEK